MIPVPVAASAVNTSQDYKQAYQFIAALTQDNPETAIVDARMIHDSDAGVAAVTLRGTLPQHWLTILQHQANGYGCFVNINDMDGVGRELHNVRACRVHVIDLDDGSAQQNFERACAWQPAPSFAVQSSPGRYHVYWRLAALYTGNDFYTSVQRRLRQWFQGDKNVIDPTRILRLPGTLHLKNPSAPHLVTCWALPAFNEPTTYQALDNALADINDIDGGAGVRKDLGDPTQAAPSLALLQHAMTLVDPNTLDRYEWVSFMASVKQAGWSLADPDTLYGMFSRWCENYEANNPAENQRQWRSLRNTEVGWPALKRRVPQMLLEMMAPGAVTVQAGQVAPRAGVTLALQLDVLKRGTNDDVALAFDAQFPGLFRFNYDTRQWLEYTGWLWEVRPDDWMRAEMRDFCRKTAGHESKTPRQANFWEGCLKALAATKELLTPQAALDCDRWLLNTPAGTIDLRTGEMRSHDRADLVTLCTEVAPGAGNGLWLAFVNDITGGDADLARYLQLVFGSALSGGIEDEFIPFLSGEGRNGKSKFVETIAYSMGGYAAFIPVNVLVEGRGDNHSTGLTDFAGKRLCIGSEVKTGSFFDTQVLKMLSGDGTITARRMGTNNFSFDRTWRLALIGNDLPQIRETDTAMKARLRIVPFNQCYAGREDRTLGERLKGDASGVLQWLIDGHAAWMESQMHAAPCKAVTEASEAYFAAQSTPAMWMSECLDVLQVDDRPQALLMTAREAYNNYRQWKVGRGEIPMSETRFGGWVTGRPEIHKEVSGRGALWRGVQHKVPDIIVGMPGV